MCGQADMYCLVVISLAIQAGERRVISLSFRGRLCKNGGTLVLTVQMFAACYEGLRINS